VGHTIQFRNLGTPSIAQERCEVVVVCIRNYSPVNGRATPVIVKYRVLACAGYCSISHQQPGGSTRFRESGQSPVVLEVLGQIVKIADYLNSQLFK